MITGVIELTVIETPGLAAWSVFVVASGSSACAGRTAKPVHNASMSVNSTVSSAVPLHRCRAVWRRSVRCGFTFKPAYSVSLRTAMQSYAHWGS